MKRVKKDMKCYNHFVKSCEKNDPWKTSELIFELAARCLQRKISIHHEDLQSAKVFDYEVGRKEWDPINILRQGFRFCVMKRVESENHEKFDNPNQLDNMDNISQMSKPQKQSTGN